MLASSSSRSTWSRSAQCSPSIRPDMLRTPTGDRSSWAVTARNRAWSSAAASSSAFASSSLAFASASALAYCSCCSSISIRSVWSRVTLREPDVLALLVHGSW